MKHRRRKDDRRASRVGLKVTVSLIAAVAASAIALIPKPVTVEDRKLMGEAAELIVRHPHQSISEDLLELVRIGSVRIEVTDVPLNDRDTVLATVVMVHQGGHLTPTVRFSRKVLTDPSYSLGLQRQVIFHEYQHVVQVTTGIVPPEDFLPHPVDRDIPYAELARNFVGECEAFTKQCQFAIAEGLKLEDPICKWYAARGDQAIKEEVARIFLGRPGYDRYRAAIADLAGGR